MQSPSTWVQALLFLLLVSPGVAYQVSRSRFRGPAPDDSSATNRILRALGFSAVLNAVYVVGLAPWLHDLIEDDKGIPSWSEVLSNARSIAAIALVLYVAVPAACAWSGLQFGQHWLPKLRVKHPNLKILHVKLRYDPTPRAWDFTFARDLDECFVRALMPDGRWVGGLLGGNSFVSSYPEPREMFLEAAYEMKEDGGFGNLVQDSDGIYIRCDDARTVEFIARPQPSPNPGEPPAGPAGPPLLAQ